VIGHQANPVHCYKFYGRFTVHNILQYYFGTGEDDIKPGLIPGNTNPSGGGDHDYSGWVWIDD
jgi:hypothetical protein